MYQIKQSHGIILIFYKHTVEFLVFTAECDGIRGGNRNEILFILGYLHVSPDTILQATTFGTMEPLSMM